jgi:predicted lipid-binding transport protein (Tim44 family)
MKLWSLCLVLLLAVSSMDADAARRLGGGQSAGQQSSSVAQREAGAPAAGPRQQQAAPNQAGTQPGAAPAQRPWGGMLGGLAAGLGLAWLAHSLGLGGALGSILLIGLLVLLGAVAVRLLMRSRRLASAQPPYAYQGAAASPRQYDPTKIGNDASARPWERNTAAFEAAAEPSAAPSGHGTRIGSGLGGSPAWDVPAGFDAQGFVDTAKRNFVALQDAWDREDMGTLRSMMTDEMLAEIRAQLAERERQQGGAPNRTEVVMLEGRLLGVEDLGDAYMASVEFSGLIREEPSSGPSPFREVWNMTKPKSGASGWLVAGLQALQ